MPRNACYIYRDKYQGISSLYFNSFTCSHRHQIFLVHFLSTISLKTKSFIPFLNLRIFWRSSQQDRTMSWVVFSPCNNALAEECWLHERSEKQIGSMGGNIRAEFTFLRFRNMGWHIHNPDNAKNVPVDKKERAQTDVFTTVPSLQRKIATFRLEVQRVRVFRTEHAL